MQFLPGRNLVAPAQCLDCLAGLESVEPMCQQVECKGQEPQQEDEEERLDKTSERETVEEEWTAVDLETDGFLVSYPDCSTTAPLALSALQARPPTQTDPPWTA